MFLGLFYKLRPLMYKYNNTSIFPVMFMTGKTLSALAKIANRSGRSSGKSEFKASSR